MENVLWKIQNTVGKYAAILSQILKVDIQIVDLNLKMITGTGHYNKRINQNISDEGHIYKLVMETGTKKIIENPREDHICFGCTARSKCIETFDMCAPIKLDNSVIGVIGFVCTTELQKLHIMNDYKTFVDFLEQIADLIALKALETEENERNFRIIQFMKEIIDNVEKGVIVFDRNKDILKINGIGKQILGIENDKINCINVQLKLVGTNLLDLKEYKVYIDDISVDVIGEEYNIRGKNYDKVFIFKDMESFRENVFELAITKERLNLNNIIGESRVIQNLNHKVKKIASTKSTVLITGESGTGKELYARALHDESDRSGGPFIAINCAAIPENLLESEMFGYVQGAFTGADPKGKIGRFELSNNGTIFLDEIGDMPLYIQIKLLRVLEQKEIIKLGSNTSIKINTRVIAATNRNLEEMVNNHAFREDLYYRLNVIPLYIPPLRERGSDISLLTNCFIDKFSKLFNKNVVSISQDFYKTIEKYNWPGNVRELQNTIEYVVNMMSDQGDINEKLLPAKIRCSAKCLKYDNYTIEDIERELFKKAIELYGYGGESKNVIAEKLGISIATLYRRLKKYNIKI